jgi:hypothetical protein
VANVTRAAHDVGLAAKPDADARAAPIQRRIAIVSNLNLASGVALVAVNAVPAHTNHSRPAKRRALTRSSPPDSSRSPLWVGSALATGAAPVDEVRRRLS